MFRAIIIPSITGKVLWQNLDNLYLDYNQQMINSLSSFQNYWYEIFFVLFWLIFSAFMPNSFSSRSSNCPAAKKLDVYCCVVLFIQHMKLALNSQIQISNIMLWYMFLRRTALEINGLGLTENRTKGARSFVSVNFSNISILQRNRW